VKRRLTDVVLPQIVSSPWLTNAAVMEMISDSNFMTDGHTSGCSGFCDGHFLKEDGKKREDANQEVKEKLINH
jgi:hypothetical protein